MRLQGTKRIYQPHLPDSVAFRLSQAWCPEDIRTTLEKRQALLDQPQLQASLFVDTNVDEWAELDGQTQVDIAIQARGWEVEKSEVDSLLELARATKNQGTDAKAEALLDLIYMLQQEENDPALKVLVFTEFVPTQVMLVEFLESRGFSIATLNGGMDLDARSTCNSWLRAGDAP